MTQPTAGEEPLPAWLRQAWQRRLLLFGLLVFLLIVTAAWAAAAIFALIVVWRHGSNPAVAVFFGVWLSLWASYPVAMFRSVRRATAIRRG
jgi:predicted MFS family arabinose efflux permease